MYKTEVQSASTEMLSAFLPHGGALRYRQDQTIYSPEQPTERLFLVVEGTVKLVWGSQDKSSVVLDLCCKGDIFGEGAFVGSGGHGECAITMEPVLLRAWHATDLERAMEDHPQLGLALIRQYVTRTQEYEFRIACLAADTIPRRLARTLIRLADRFGKTRPDGAVTLMPLTHQFLGQYVGTSREIVTQHMNRLRRADCLEYSRNEILVHKGALAAWLSPVESPTTPVTGVMSAGGTVSS